MDTEVREIFERLVADPPTTSVNADAAIRDGQRRLTRRRQIWIGTASAAVLASAATFSALTGENVPASDPRPGPLSTVDPSIPDVVEVTCTEDSVRLSADVVRARPAGVLLVVSNTARPGTYLRYHSTGSGGTSGAEDIPAKPTTWTLRLAPGTITLGCFDATADQAAATATVKVLDPGGYWHGTEAIDRFSCGGGAVRDWTRPFFQEGATELAAAQAVAGAFAESEPSARTPGTYSVEPLVVGYLDDPTRTWLIRLNGNPHATVLVAKEGDRYKAGPDMNCGPES